MYLLFLRLNKSIIFLNGSFLNYLIAFCFLKVLQILLLEAELDVRKGSDESEVDWKELCKGPVYSCALGLKEIYCSLKFNLIF